MRRTVVAIAVVFVLVSTSCRTDTVDLSYRFPVGSRLTYEVVSQVQAQWNIGTEGSGSYRVTFDVTEEVRSVDEDGAVVSLDLERTSAEEDNFTPPGDSSFTVRVDPHGAVRDVIEVDGVAATLLEPEQRSLIRTYRPLLAVEPVRLYEEWDALQEFEGPEFEEIKVVGRLERLDVDESGEFADVSYTGRGPLIGTRELPEGNAELSGSTSTTGEAIIGLDDGVLREATSTTRYNFDVTVVPEDAGTPLNGTLQINETLELRRVDEGSDR